MTKPDAPERIWLQIPPDYAMPDYETTWCVNKINAEDVEYRRADTTQPLAVEAFAAKVAELAVSYAATMDLDRAVVGAIRAAAGREPWRPHFEFPPSRVRGSSGA